MSGDLMDPKYSDVVRVPSPHPPIAPDLGVRQIRELEKSAVREAIAAVCEDGSKKLQVWMDKIEQENGAKVAFDCFIKLLDFCQPRLQRVIVEDPDGQSVNMPIINLNFAIPKGAKPLDIELKEPILKPGGPDANDRGDEPSDFGD